MEYKGNHIHSAEAILLYDILQIQQEILAELKKQNDPVTDVSVIPETAQEEEYTGLTEETPEVAEAIVQATEQIKALAKEVKPTVKKPVKNPVQKKPAAKRKPAKKKAKKTAK
jgi:hypothetical protein